MNPDITQFISRPRPHLRSLGATIPDATNHWSALYANIVYGGVLPAHWLRVSGAWKRTITWLRVGGVWLKATPWTRIAGSWRS
jgi:hypothetical protein